jgi:uncharacterized membrane protein
LEGKKDLPGFWQVGDYSLEKILVTGAGLIVMVPIMAVVVMMIIVMAIIGLALVVVAARPRRAYGDGNLSFRFRGNQSEKPQRGEDQ